jgi:2-C-methyl-D-erythritol 2,4-cyclodiphosphate synthase/ribosomal subunit interface protein
MTPRARWSVIRCSIDLSEPPYATEPPSPRSPCRTRSKRSDDAQRVRATVPREGLYRVQTPQIFRADWLLDAHHRAAEAGFEQATDDAQLLERADYPVHLVEGDPRNLKLTTPDDLHLLRLYAGEGALTRTGIGYDIHRLTEGRTLMLGGVAIDYPYGLQGHSDADVVLHAICDALLGAAALGDIGQHFPNTDPRWKDAPSLTLLGHVRALLMKHGWQPLHIDAMALAEAPKLAPYIPEMRQRIARTLGILLPNRSVSRRRRMRAWTPSASGAPSPATRSPPSTPPTERQTMSKSRRKQVEIVDVTFRSPHQELSEAEKAYVRRKLHKLARFFHKIWALEVTYELVRGQHRVSVLVDADGQKFHYDDTGHEFRAAVDAVVQRLEHQLARYKERLQKRGRQTREEVIEAVLSEGESEAEEKPVPNPTIRRVVRVPLKPMSIEEALLQAELEGAPVYMFYDADANRSCVLVQVEKGVYDLIEGID